MKRFVINNFIKVNTCIENCTNYYFNDVFFIDIYEADYTCLIRDITIKFGFNIIILHRPTVVCI